MVYTNPLVLLESVTMTGSQDTELIVPLPEAIGHLHLFQAKFVVAEEEAAGPWLRPPRTL